MPIPQAIDELIHALTVARYIEEKAAAARALREALEQYHGLHSEPPAVLMHGEEVVQYVVTSSEDG